MSRFTETMYDNAQSSLKGMITGEPDAPVRHTWRQVHERARRVAGGLAAAGVGHGDAVAVLAGAARRDRPDRAGHLDARRQPDDAAPAHAAHRPATLGRGDHGRHQHDRRQGGRGLRSVHGRGTAAGPAGNAGADDRTVARQSRRSTRIDTDDDDVALLQLTSGSTGSPKAVRISHRNVVSNAEAMFVGANVDPESDVIVSWLPCFHDMGMTGYLTVPMYFGVELVKVTPMDFLRDTLLWAKLIDKYRGTMTAAPNFAYTMFAKRLRRQAQPGQFDLSTLRWALSGAEQVEPADVEDLCEAGAPFGLRPEAIVPAYGMAETTVAVSFTECGRGLDGRRGRRRPARRAAPSRPGDQG